jgi:hypothetical protein
VGGLGAGQLLLPTEEEGGAVSLRQLRYRPDRNSVSTSTVRSSSS